MLVDLTGTRLERRRKVWLWAALMFGRWFADRLLRAAHAHCLERIKARERELWDEFKIDLFKPADDGPPTLKTLVQHSWGVKQYTPKPRKTAGTRVKPTKPPNRVPNLERGSLLLGDGMYNKALTEIAHIKGLARCHSCDSILRHYFDASGRDNLIVTHCNTPHCAARLHVITPIAKIPVTGEPLTQHIRQGIDLHFTRVQQTRLAGHQTSSQIDQTLTALELRNQHQQKLMQAMLSGTQSSIRK